ncbi:hypothetical protein Psta_0193 [Pirellula staleyi DSM 6068]|uniref:Uncharacterized protein n=1 Tax=Pirellula staleyi (strain ATCC 27377 / DSM 6068 / ICPB 4128) TaxID=530564 RepID=D2R1A4_PIRSD|nr:hypothetical protein [Pirellula staleyi]ADB14889.1 hypothetical protein Psta_0193 [Pirellula staleyi DSM 6068]
MAAKSKARLTSFFALARKARLWQMVSQRGRMTGLKRPPVATSARKIVAAIALVIGSVALTSTGCQGTWEQLKGPGFKGWSGGMSEGVRSSGPASPDAKPSGFFTDRRSEQIEQNLGGF